jgi:hypothetical protein
MLRGHGRTSSRSFRAAISQQYSVARFATLRVASCLHSPGLRCSSYNVVRFCCDLESCNFVKKYTLHFPVSAYIFLVLFSHSHTALYKCSMFLNSTTLVHFIIFLQAPSSLITDYFLLKEMFSFLPRYATS